MQAKVFNKGQIVIPAALRKKYGIRIGNKVEIIEEEEGIKIVPIKEDNPITAIAGVFSEYAKKELSKEDISRITEKAFVETFKNEIY